MYQITPYLDHLLCADKAKKTMEKGLCYCNKVILIAKFETATVSIIK